MVAFPDEVVGHYEWDGPDGVWVFSGFTIKEIEAVIAEVEDEKGGGGRRVEEPPEDL